MVGGWCRWEGGAPCRWDGGAGGRVVQVGGWCRWEGGAGGRVVQVEGGAGGEKSRITKSRTMGSGDLNHRPLVFMSY